MKKEELFRNLRTHYTPEEAKEAIDAVLKKYGDTCTIFFGKYNAEIQDSYKVNSTRDRHLISEIIARTDLTQRNNEDLSAEWEVHNMAYRFHVARSHAKDVNLDYTRDPRKAVRVVTKIFDILNIE